MKKIITTICVTLILGSGVYAPMAAAQAPPMKSADKLAARWARSFAPTSFKTHCVRDGRNADACTVTMRDVTGMVTVDDDPVGITLFDGIEVGYCGRHSAVIQSSLFVTHCWRK